MRGACLPLSAMFLIFILCLLGFGSGKTILFLSCWQKSPIISLQGLAEELVGRGHTVLFAVTTNDAHLVSSVSVGVEFIDAGNPPNSDEFYDFAQDIQSLWWGEADYARSMFHTLLPKLKNRQIDLIAHDPLAIAGEALGQALNVPTVQVSTHLFTLAHLGADSIFTPEIISGLSKSTMGIVGALENAILTYVARYILPVARGALQNPFRAATKIPTIWLESQNPYGRTKLLIASSPFGFEYARSMLPLFQSTGPFLPRSHRPLDTSVSSWIEKESSKPLVYVSIGTNSDYDAEVANTLAQALLKGTQKYRILWSIKKVHQGLFTKDVADEIQKNQDLRIEAFVEQLAVLGSNKTKAFLSHCGYASTSESIFYGVPLICMPMMLTSDQPTIAARVLELGLGSWVDRRRGVNITVDQVLSSIEYTLLPGVQSKAQQFSSFYHKLNGRARAAELIELAMHPVGYVELLSVDQQPHYVVYAILGGVWAVFAWAFWLCCRSKKKKPPTSAFLGPNQKKKNE